MTEARRRSSCSTRPAGRHRPTSTARSPAAPARLDGAVVGLVVNGLGRAEPFLAAVFDEELAAKPLVGAVPGGEGQRVGTARPGRLDPPDVGGDGRDHRIRWLRLV